MADTKLTLQYLRDAWDEAQASQLDPAELLRYRSNLLGADLRITNFGGGNTSAKLRQPDPLNGEVCNVLWVKGSGGDLGSIRREGFATLYLDKLRGLERTYPGPGREDEMVARYPLCTFGLNPVAASIDTPLHGFLPDSHVDHLHPDAAIALAAAANGREKLEEFNRQSGHRLAWLPWRRPGFELGLELRRAAASLPGCDGVILASHGLFTWGESSRECYRNTLRVIDDFIAFVEQHAARHAGRIFGGAAVPQAPERRAAALALLPFLRGRVSAGRRLIGHYSDAPAALEFACSRDAAELSRLGTSCPDHFLRTKIRPLFVAGDPSCGPDSQTQLRAAIEAGLESYRRDYAAYYQVHADASSPAMRDPNPTVAIVPGLGLFSFGKNKTEARITAEFYLNAIQVMRGATCLTGKAQAAPGAMLPQCGPDADPRGFASFHNYVALPPREAFRIEYWALEEAKLRRQPPERELGGQVALIAGAGSGIGREAALLAAARGAHVVCADLNLAAAQSTAREIEQVQGRERALALSLDITRRDSIRAAAAALTEAFGGLDIICNTAAIFPVAPAGGLDEAGWARALEINVTANFWLVDELGALLRDQNLPVSIVLTGSANAVVPKSGSEAYDVSKAALGHLVRELAVSRAPLARVNAISPATVIAGSAMFPRDRVIASLRKYQMEFSAAMSDDELRNILAGFYARRTLTHRPITPRLCAEAMLFLAGPASGCTSGHILPVDGGLPEAFLR